MNLAGARRRLLRNAQRLMPPGLAAVALLPPPPGPQWAASPLSRLKWACLPRRGWLGLCLDPAQARRLSIQGLAGLRSLPRDRDGAPAYGEWQPLPGGTGVYWTRAAAGALGLLVDARQARAWLLWQDPDGLVGGGRPRAAR